MARARGLRARGFSTGRGVALCKQTETTLTALAVGNDQRLHVAWVDGTGPWNPPTSFGPAIFPPGAPIALCKQTQDVLTALVDWPEQDALMSLGGGHRHHGASQFPSARSIFTERECMRLCKQTDNVLTALAVSARGPTDYGLGRGHRFLDLEPVAFEPCRVPPVRRLRFATKPKKS